VSASFRNRFLMTLTGEGLQGGFHFALSILMIGILTPHDYGVFSIVFVIGAVAQSYVTILAATPAAVFIGRSRSRLAGHLQDVLFGGLAFTLAMGFSVLTGIGFLLAGGDGATAGSSAAFVALWSLRTYMRSGLLARRMSGPASVADLTFALCGGAFVILSLILGIGMPLSIVFGLLAAANGAGLVVAGLGLRRPLRVSLRRSLRRRLRARLPALSWSLVTVTTAMLQAQAQTLLVAGFVGPAAYAPIAAIFVLFGPMRLAVNALTAARMTDLAQSLVSSDHERLRALLSQALLLAGCVFGLFGAAVWLVWPTLRFHIYDRSFAAEPMGLIAVLAWLVMASAQTYAVPRALLDAACQFRDVAIGAALGAAVGLVGVAVLLASATPAWSILGLLAAELVTLVYYGLRASALIEAPAGARIRLS